MTEITLSTPIRRNSADINTDDIFQVKTGLHKIGHYKEPSYGITPYPDEQLFKSIQSFQKENDLRIDGIMNPNGETINTLNKKLIKTSAKSPTIWCTICGGPHGGSKGEICPQCDSKT